MYQSKSIIWKVIILIFLISCTSEDPEPVKQVTAGDLQFKVSYYEPFDKTVYPSLVVGLAQLADEMKLFSLEILNSTNETLTAMVTIEANTLVDRTVLTLAIDPGINEVDFKPNWSYDKLIHLDQPGNTSFSFSVSIDGEVLATDNFTLANRPINECVFGFMDEEGKYQNLEYMFAAYVNEDHPMIDPFLSEAKESGIVTGYSGYQGTTDDVLLELFSLWYHLQRNEVNYVNLTTTSNPSNTIYSQSVRFFDQVIDNAGANCVDGSVFHASILMKLGIDPVLILQPQHMYLGVFLGDRSDFITLETTLIGAVDINAIQTMDDLEYYYNQGYFSQEQMQYFANSCSSSNGCDMESMRIWISYVEFVKAVLFQELNFEDNLSNFEDPENHQYELLDISELRKIISPIQR